MEFSVRSMRNLIREQGDKRVGKSSSVELGEILERFAGDIAEEANAVAKEAGYKTVRKEHVRKALR